MVMWMCVVCSAQATLYFLFTGGQGCRLAAEVMFQTYDKRHQRCFGETVAPKRGANNYRINPLVNPVDINFATLSGVVNITPRLLQRV
jgi:hypothetical protein